MNDALLTNIISDIIDSIDDRSRDLNSTEALKVYKEVAFHCQAWIEALHNVVQDRIDVLTAEREDCRQENLRITRSWHEAITDYEKHVFEVEARNDKLLTAIMTAEKLEVLKQ